MSNPYGNPGYAPPGQYQQHQPPARVERVTVARDGRGMATLRVITYILASLASLLFIALVIYGYLQLRNLQAALEGFTGSFPSIPLPR